MSQIQMAQWINRIPLRRADVADDAGLLICSLPWSRDEAMPLGLGDQPTHVKPLGQWYDQAAANPRRMLMIAQNKGAAPDALSLTDKPAASAGSPPVATMPLLNDCSEPGYMRQVHILRVEHEGKHLEIALGLKHNGQTNWWEACRLVEDHVDEHCRTITMAGAIPRIATTREDLQKQKGMNFELLHKHNWLYGTLHLRLHSNGVCEVFARHENNMYVDPGCDLEDVVPVIGFRAEGALKAAGTPWTGETKSLAFDDVKLDMAEAARLATPKQPGSLEKGDHDLLVYQPYEAVDIFGGSCLIQRYGHGFAVKAEQRLFPRGVARTVRFGFSLSDASPRVARYVAPYWWYGLTEEITVKPYLPVRGPLEDTIEDTHNWYLNAIHEGGFDDGAMPRHDSKFIDEDAKRHEPGWEGEIPYCQLLDAYRTGDGEAYAKAMRSVYHYTDVAVDHTEKVTRMHGFELPAIALPMSRVQACIFGYLEMGDPYLFDTAESVVEGAYRLHLNSWPRLAMGRDACFIRGAVMLYRYFNDEHFLKIAKRCAQHVVEVQRENGSFGDQGGGTGIHQWGAFITKPWMALLATMPVLDVLELCPDEPRLKDCIIKLGEFLLSVQWERDGMNTWSYQLDYAGEPRHYDFYNEQWLELPSKAQWHQENLARLLGYCTLWTGDEKYLAAWAESYKTKYYQNADHYRSSVMQFLPWLQNYTWQAEWTDQGVKTNPISYGPATPDKVTVQTPEGEVELTR